MTKHPSNVKSILLFVAVYCYMMDFSIDYNHALSWVHRWERCECGPISGLRSGIGVEQANLTIPGFRWRPEPWSQEVLWAIGQ